MDTIITIEILCHNNTSQFRARMCVMSRKWYNIATKVSCIKNPAFNARYNPKSLPCPVCNKTRRKTMREISRQYKSEYDDTHQQATADAKAYMKRHHMWQLHSGNCKLPTQVKHHELVCYHLMVRMKNSRVIYRRACDKETAEFAKAYRQYTLWDPQCLRVYKSLPVDLPASTRVISVAIQLARVSIIEQIFEDAVRLGRGINISVFANAYTDSLEYIFKKYNVMAHGYTFTYAHIILCLSTISHYNPPLRIVHK